jgi:hypothetical protein
MIRRAFLQSLGALGAVSGAEPEKTRFYTLESFLMKNGEQTGRLHEFLSRGFLPAAQKVHSGPKLFLDAQVAPHMPQTLAILGFKSAAEALDLYAKLHAQPGYNEALAQWEAGPQQPYETASLTLLSAEDYSPEIAASAPDAPQRVFELRVYHSQTWRQLKALHERFAGPETRIFHRSGIHPALYTTTVFGTNMPNLTYLTPFESLAAREKAWAAFGADPEWQKVRKESLEKHGQIANVIEISLYRATAYSPVK